MAPIKLETATQEELETINGIGPQKAKKIIQQRDGDEWHMQGLVIATGIPQDEWARLYDEGVVTMEFPKEELQVPEVPLSPTATKLTKQIAEMRVEAAQREREIAQRDREIAQRDREMAQRDRETQIREKEFPEKELQVPEVPLSPTATKLTKQIAEMRAEAAHRDREMAQRDRETKIREKEQEKQIRMLLETLGLMTDGKPEGGVRVKETHPSRGKGVPAEEGKWDLPKPVGTPPTKAHKGKTENPLMLRLQGVYPKGDMYRPPPHRQLRGQDEEVKKTKPATVATVKTEPVSPLKVSKMKKGGKQATMFDPNSDDDLDSETTEEEVEDSEELGEDEDGYGSAGAKERAAALVVEHSRPSEELNEDEDGNGSARAKERAAALVVEHSRPSWDKGRREGDGRRPTGGARAVRRHHRSDSRGSPRPYRRRSPPPPKMESFDGDPAKWKSFWFSFKMMAKSHQWNKSTKLDRLLMSMREKAVDYLLKRPVGIRSSYDLLVHNLRRRYEQKVPPAASRKQLSYIKQEDTEELADYAERVHQLVLDGYPGVDQTNIQLLAIEAFLRGCHNKLAAIMASSHKLKSLHQAVRKVNEGIHSQKSIGKLQMGVGLRQVNFNVEESFTSPPSSEKATVELDEAELAAVVAEAVKVALQGFKRSSWLGEDFSI